VTFYGEFFDEKGDIMRNEYEREETNATTKLTYLLVGGGIGAILALLFAPKSGQELRGDIADVTRKGLEKGKETAALVGERAGEYYEVTRDRASEFYQTAQEKAGQFSEKAKEAVASTKNPFSAALEAGKEAYAEEKRRTGSKAITEGRPTYSTESQDTSAGTGGSTTASADTSNKTDTEG
jgi:gas vesicle protein